MTKEELKKSSTKDINSLAVKMLISLGMAVVVGIIAVFLREYFNSNAKGYIWDAINRLLFQDISTADGKNSIGIFYILGQIFINSLQLVIVPMIFSSIALAMCRINDTKKLGRISTKTLLGFLTTSVLALILAGILSFIGYKAGIFNLAVESKETVEMSVSQLTNPLMVLIEAVPSNIVSVFSTNGRVLAVVFTAVATGLCINQLGNKAKYVKGLLEDINNIINVFLNYVIVKFSPIAVFILIVRTFAVYGIDRIKPALAYMATVSIAAMLFLFLGYPLFIYVTTGLNPIKFMKKIIKVALLGFSAASSAAALSLNMKTNVEELGVNEEVAAFTLPLGMTINMNGTAIMQVVATIFIAASSGYIIRVSDVVLIAVLALIASVGTPSAPGSSMIILFSVLNGMGYNNEGVLIAYSMLLAINRPMDMLVTSLNVVGDAAAAVVVSKSEGCLDTELYNN